MKLRNLNDLLVMEIQDLYDAELQITQAVPQMVDMLTSQSLKDAFNRHLEQTRTQVTRLEKIAAELGIDPRGKSCIGMEGIIEEGVELMQENEPSEALDAALLAAAQKVEHYEIAGYGTVRTFAHHLGYEEAASKLQQILDEEKAADKKLTTIAEENINLVAAEHSR